MHMNPGSVINTAAAGLVTVASLTLAAVKPSGNPTHVAEPMRSRIAVAG
jgi:hypothetical protein